MKYLNNKTWIICFACIMVSSVSQAGTLDNVLSGFCASGKGEAFARNLDLISQQIQKIESTKGDVCRNHVPIDTSSSATRMEQILAEYNGMISDNWKIMKSNMSKPATRELMANMAHVPFPQVSLAMSSDTSPEMMLEDDVKGSNWIADGSMPPSGISIDAPAGISLCDLKNNVAIWQIGFPKNDASLYGNTCDFMKPFDPLKKIINQSYLIPQAEAADLSWFAGVEFNVAINTSPVLMQAINSLTGFNLPDGLGVQVGVIRTSSDAEMYEAVSSNYTLQQASGSAWSMNIKKSDLISKSAGVSLLATAGDKCTLADMVGPSIPISFTSGVPKSLNTGIGISLGIMPNGGLYVDSNATGSEKGSMCYSLTGNCAPNSTGQFILDVKQGPFGALNQLMNVPGDLVITLFRAAWHGLRKWSVTATRDEIAAKFQGFLPGARTVASSSLTDGSVLKNLKIKDLSRCYSVGVSTSSSASIASTLAVQASTFDSGNPELNYWDIADMTLSAAAFIGSTVVVAGNTGNLEKAFWVGLGSFLVPQVPTIVRALACTQATGQALLNNGYTGGMMVAGKLYHHHIPKYCMQSDQKTALMFMPAAGWVDTWNSVNATLGTNAHVVKLKAIYAK